MKETLISTKIFIMVSWFQLTKFLTKMHQKEMCMAMNVLMSKSESTLVLIFCNSSRLVAIELLNMFHLGLCSPLLVVLH